MSTLKRTTNKTFGGSLGALTALPVSGSAPLDSASYTTVAVAEASGDNWADGAIITITDPTPDVEFIYFSNMATYGKGLRHRYPFNDGVAYGSNTVISDEGKGTDPATWSDWNRTLIDSSTVGTNGGYSELYASGSTNSARYILWPDSQGDSTNIPGNTDMFAIWESGGVTLTSSPSIMSVAVYLNAYVNGSTARNQIIAVNPSSGSSWVSYNGSAYVAMSTSHAYADPVRFWMYVNGTKSTVWDDTGIISTADRTRVHTPEGMYTHNSLSGNSGNNRALLLGNHIFGNLNT